MTVNITLLFQVIQFFIAYYFLRTFVFLPGLRLLQKKKQVLHDLHTQLDAQSALLHEIAQYKKLERQKLRENLLASMPGSQTVVPSNHYINDLIMYDQQLASGDKKALQKSIIHHLSLHE